MIRKEARYKDGYTLRKDTQGFLEKLTILRVDNEGLWKRAADLGGGSTERLRLGPITYAVSRSRKMLEGFQLIILWHFRSEETCDLVDVLEVELTASSTC